MHPNLYFLVTHFFIHPNLYFSVTHFFMHPNLYFSVTHFYVHPSLYFSVTHFIIHSNVAFWVTQFTHPTDVFWLYLSSMPLCPVDTDKLLRWEFELLGIGERLATAACETKLLPLYQQHLFRVQLCHWCLLPCQANLSMASISYYLLPHANYMLFPAFLTGYCW